MSLDFDRSADGEPPARAGQPPAPAQQAPATPERPSGSAPAFTPATAATGSESADDEPATYYPTTYERAADEPAATEPAADEPEALKPAGEPAVTDAAAGEPATSELTADGLDGPLLSDADELRASWQRIQAAFVDDPREAVADAAGLVEHTAQALAGALRLRQQQLRALWDRDGVLDGVEYADSGSTAPRAVSPGGDPQAAADGPGTEQLRLLIQRYRVLFNSLCRP